MKIGSLFSGIGGLELGLEWSGLGHTVWQVESDDFCRRVLARHWPHAKRYEDVKTVGASVLEPVDLLCGGFPCQDVSSAGKGAGLAGERSGLWREYARIAVELRPRWVCIENVASGANRWVDSVCRDLEVAGYAPLPLPVSAKDVGAPHLRRRVFIVGRLAANPDGDGDGVRNAKQREPGGRAGAVRHTRIPKPQHTRKARHASDPDGQRLEEYRGPGADVSQQPWPWRDGPTEPPVCGVDDGFSSGLDGGLTPKERNARLAALGNAVVPQCARVIGWVIRELGGQP